MALTKTQRRNRIKLRSRSVISGTSARPRMCVFRSNKQIYVQLIDDVQGVTLNSLSSSNKEIAEKQGNKSEKAAMVGEMIAKVAVESGIQKIVFDRNGYLYHGRIKQLADAARKGGLKF